MRSLTGLNANPAELAVKVAIRWGNYVWSYYATRKDNQWEPKIQAFGGLQSSTNSDGSASLTQTTLTLFDGAESQPFLGLQQEDLQQVITRGEAEGSEAIVYLDDQEIFRGQVRNAVWSDENQTLTMDLVSYIESREVGYVVDKNIYGPNNDVVVGKPWPVVFGNPKHVPAVFAQSTPRSELQNEVTLAGNIFDRGLYGGDEINYPLDENGLKLINVFSIEEVLQVDIDNEQVEIQADTISVEDKTKFPVGVFKVSIEGVIFRVQRETADSEIKVLESNIAKYSNVACKARKNDSDRNNPKVLWLDDRYTNIDMIDHFVYIERTRDNYVWDEGEKEFVNEPIKDRYENVCVRQEGLKCWFKYPFFFNQIPGSEKHPRATVSPESTWGLIGQNVTISEIKSLPDTGLLIELEELFKNVKEKLKQANRLRTNNGFTALAEHLDLIRYLKSAFWTASPGVEVVEWEPEEGDIYIANYFESQEITGVYAKCTAGFKPVPTSYFDIDLSKTANLDNGTSRKVTTIEMRQPLDTYKNQGWDPSTIYVTLKSSVVPDGNPARICEYLLSNFTNFNLESFNGVAQSLSNNIMDFAKLEVLDAFEFARQIAWQARSALVSDTGRIKMVNASLEGSPHYIFNENNTHFQSIQITQVPLDRIITKQIGSWREDFEEEDRFTSFALNQNKYGHIPKQHDMYAYNVEEPAYNALQFWTNRSAISWKVVELTADPSAMNLQIYDIVRLNFTAFPSLFNDTGVVVAYNYDFVNQQAQFTILTAVPSGTTANDPRFWLNPIGPAPRNPAEDVQLTNYSPVKSEKKSLDELMRELRKLEDTAKLLGKVTKVEGSLVDVDLYPGGPLKEKTREITAHDVNAHDGIEVGDWVEIKDGQDGVHYIRKFNLPKIFGIVEYEGGEPPSTNKYRIRPINFLNNSDVGFGDGGLEEAENYTIGDNDDELHVEAVCFEEISKKSIVGRVPDNTIVELKWGTANEIPEGFWYFNDSSKGYYFAKVTSSSASSPSLSLVEVDANKEILQGGRTSDTAEAPMGRPGIPIDTYGFAFELQNEDDVVTIFMPWDGSLVDPKILKGKGQTPDTTTWDVREDSAPADITLFRIDCVDGVYATFDRGIKLDSNGFVYFSSGENKSALTADAPANPASGWLTILPTEDGGKVLHNAPGNDIRHFEITFTAGTNVSINGNPSGSVAVGFYADLLGHVTLADDVNQTIEISATGGGSADGKGYEFVDHNGANTGTEPDNGTINFKDNGTTPTLPDVGVAWTLTNNAGTDTVDVEGKVTLPIEDNYPSSVSVDVVTDVRVDPSTFKLQKRVISITALKSAAASGTATGAWVDVHTGEECP